jgi:hypothetical protein
MPESSGGRGSIRHEERYHNFMRILRDMVHLTSQPRVCAVQHIIIEFEVPSIIDPNSLRIQLALSFENQRTQLAFSTPTCQARQQQREWIRQR